MILAGTPIRKAIITALTPVLGSSIPVYSVMPPDNVLKYVIITSLSENALDEKRAFISEGVINIQVVEKFDTRDGDLDWVNTIASLISKTLTPDRLATFGNVDGIDLFSLWIDSNAESLFDTDPGRTAISSLRIRYYAQNT